VWDAQAPAAAVAVVPLLLLLPQQLHQLLCLHRWQPHQQQLHPLLWVVLHHLT
jgi:hypothetical protein